VRRWAVLTALALLLLPGCGGCGGRERNKNSDLDRPKAGEKK
jgi:outer membrane biogenesis lipoprotein LolB